MIDKNHNLAAALKAMNVQQCGYTSHSYAVTPKGIRVARFTVRFGKRVERINHRRAVGDDPTQNEAAMELLESTARLFSRADTFVLLPDYAAHAWDISSALYVPRPLTFDVDDRKFHAVPARNQRDWMWYIAPILRAKGILSQMLKGEALALALTVIDAMPLHQHNVGSLVSRINSVAHHAIDTAVLNQMTKRDSING